MTATVVQFVTKPNPGSDPAKIIEQAKEAAGFWRKHGGEVSYWSVVAGEMGNFAFMVRFNSFADYGKAMDSLAADAAFAEWQARRAKAGLVSWVRSNVGIQVEI